MKTRNQLFTKFFGLISINLDDVRRVELVSKGPDKNHAALSWRKTSVQTLEHLTPLLRPHLGVKHSSLGQSVALETGRPFIEMLGQWMVKVVSVFIILASLANVTDASPLKEITLYPQLGTSADLKIQTRMKAFRGSKIYQTRQRMYAKQWHNPSTVIHYADGHSLTINTKNHPETAYGSAVITPIVKDLGTTPDPDPTKPMWDCSSTDTVLTADSTSYMNNDYSNANSHLYPGAIFTFDDFFQGAYREQAGARNPITLVIDNPDINGSDEANVTDPSVETCRQGVSTLFHRLNTNPDTQGLESFSYDVLQSNDSAELNIQVSGGASGFGLSFTNAFSQVEKDKTISLTIDARKSFYSISVAPEESTFFRDGNIDATPDLMIISNVSYGVRVLANMNITFDSTSDKDSFAAKYDGPISADAAFSLLKTTKHASTAIHAYIVGGPRNGEVSFNEDQLQSQIESALQGATYQNAKPIGYQLMDMAGDIVGTESATDVFHNKTCAPSLRSPHVTSIRLHVDNGRDGKDGDTKVGVWLFPGEFNPQGPDEPDAIAGYLQTGGEYAAGRGYDIQLNLAPNDVARQKVDMTLDYFIKNNGGHIHLDCFRNGNDTWIVNHAFLLFNFEDGTDKSVDLSNFSSSQGQGPIDWYFDAHFQVKKH